jgi:hypothetical protein
VVCQLLCCIFRMDVAVLNPFCCVTVGASVCFGLFAIFNRLLCMNGQDLISTLARPLISIRVGSSH